VDCAKSWIKKHSAAKNKDVELNKELVFLTLEVISRTAFGSVLNNLEVNYLKNGETRKIKLQNAIDELFSKNIKILLGNPLFSVFPDIMKYNFFRVNREFNNNNAAIREKVKEIIISRAQVLESKTNTDFLLIDMLIRNMNAGQLTMEEVISDANLFILAGHETSARVLSGFFSRIAQHPEIVKKIRSEIKEKIMEGKIDIENIDAYITYEKIQELSYTGMCIKEALRIDPPLTHIPLTTKETIDFNGVKVFKGMGFRLHTMSIHSNPLVWHRPREFIPERFDPTSIYYKTPSEEKKTPNGFRPFLSRP